MIRRFLRKPAGVAAATWLLLVLACAVFAPLIAPDNPQAQDLSAALSGPSRAHLLGADPLGRDVLSQMIYGARPVLIGVACAVATWLVLGVSLGITAGYLRGGADAAISRTADLLLSLPGLVVLLVVFSVFPGSLIVPMLILGVLASAGLTRIVRSVTLTVREDLYVKAAQVLGLTRARIMIRHVLPRVASAVIVQAGLFASIALVIQNGLIFLGFGVVMPNPSWGGVLAEAAQELLRSPWLLVPSGGAVALTVLAFVLLANAIRDTWTEAWAPSQLSGTAPAARTLAAGPTPETAISDAVLVVHGLSVEFAGPRPVVSDVSFGIGQGETLVVVGETGCGKSVMALAVLGLLPAGARRTAGTVRLDGVDLTMRSPRELVAVRGTRIGYVAQDPMVSLDPNFTVGAQITEAIRLHCRVSGEMVSRKTARNRVVELLGAVNLRDPAAVARKYPHQLSGGMLQRCIIALALSGDPELLIADEPTTALDVTTQAEILALLRHLQETRNMAILLITHDWEVVAQIADRTVVMYAGEIVEEAAAADLLAAPEHPYARALLACDPVRGTAGRRLPVIPGSVPVPGAWPSGCRFAPRCAEAEPKCSAAPVAFTQTAPDHITRCVHAEAKVEA